MIATTINCLKGPALLAQAGVTLNDALWLYRSGRSAPAQDVGRLVPIRRKVDAFLARGCGVRAVQPRSA